MRKYRRRLPHIDVPGAPTFVTWRLLGSLPAERSFRAEHLSSGAQPAIATVVMEQLRRVPALHAYVIMPNHVHVLWTPAGSVAELVCQVKGATALHVNRLLGRSGSFWQPEYFDRVVRNDREFESIRAYIVRSPEEFVWSSAWRG